MDPQATKRKVEIFLMSHPICLLDCKLIVVFLITSILADSFKAIVAQSIVHRSEFNPSPMNSEASPMSHEDDEFSKTIVSHSGANEDSANGVLRPTLNQQVFSSPDTTGDTRPQPIWSPIDDTSLAGAALPPEPNEEFAGQAAESGVGHQFISVINNQSNVVVEDPGSRVNYGHEDHFKSNSVSFAMRSDDRNGTTTWSPVSTAVGFNESFVTPTNENTIQNSHDQPSGLEQTQSDDRQVGEGKPPPQEKKKKRRKTKIVKKYREPIPSNKNMGAMITYSAVTNKQPKYPSLPMIMSFNGSPVNIEALREQSILPHNTGSMFPPTDKVLGVRGIKTIGFFNGLPYIIQESSTNQNLPQVFSSPLTMKLAQRNRGRTIMGGPALLESTQGPFEFQQKNSGQLSQVQPFEGKQLDLDQNVEQISAASSRTPNNSAMDTASTSMRPSIMNADSDEDDGPDDDIDLDIDMVEGIGQKATSGKTPPATKPSGHSKDKSIKVDTQNGEYSTKSQVTRQVAVPSFDMPPNATNRPEYIDSNGHPRPNKPMPVLSPPNIEQELLVGPFKSESEAPATITLAGIVYQKSGSSSSLIEAPRQPNGERDSLTVSGSTSSSTLNASDQPTQQQSFSKQVALVTNVSPSQHTGLQEKLWPYLTVVPQSSSGQVFSEQLSNGGGIILSSFRGEQGSNQSKKGVKPQELATGGTSSSSTNSYRIPVSDLSIMSSLSGGVRFNPLPISGNAATIITTAGSSSSQQQSNDVARLKGILESSSSGNIINAAINGHGGSSGQSPLSSILDSPTSISLSTSLLNDPSPTTIWTTDQKGELQHQGSSLSSASSDLSGQESKHSKEKPIVIVQKDVKPVKYHLLRAYLKLRRLLRPFETTYVFPNESNGYIRRRNHYLSNRIGKLGRKNADRVKD